VVGLVLALAATVLVNLGYLREYDTASALPYGRRFHDPCSSPADF
jgi:hypothetical protein